MQFQKTLLSALLAFTQQSYSTQLTTNNINCVIQAVPLPNHKGGPKNSYLFLNAQDIPSAVPLFTTGGPSHGAVMTLVPYAAASKSTPTLYYLNNNNNGYKFYHAEMDFSVFSYAAYEPMFFRTPKTSNNTELQTRFSLNGTGEDTQVLWLDGKGQGSGEGFAGWLVCSSAYYPNYQLFFRVATYGSTRQTPHCVDVVLKVLELPG